MDILDRMTECNMKYEKQTGKWAIGWEARAPYGTHKNMLHLSLMHRCVKQQRIYFCMSRSFDLIES
jgi:hypothetical protein